MKLLDTNVFIRALADQVTDADRRMGAAAQALLEAVQSGDDQVTIYETVVD